MAWSHSPKHRLDGTNMQARGGSAEELQQAKQNL